MNEPTHAGEVTVAFDRQPVVLVRERPGHHLYWVPLDSHSGAVCVAALAHRPDAARLIARWDLGEVVAEASRQGLDVIFRSQ